MVRPRSKLRDSQAPWRCAQSLRLLLYQHKLLDVFIEINFYRKYTQLKNALSYTTIEQHRVSCACEECALCEVRGHSVLQKAPTCPCSQGSQVPASPCLNHTSVVHRRVSLPFLEFFFLKLEQYIVFVFILWFKHTSLFFPR